jgi:hypothetical protein
LDNRLRSKFTGIARQGSWDFREAGINFTTSPYENLRIGAQFYARDLGELGNDKVELDWAYGDYKFHDAIGFRAGRYKIPRGLYNEVQDYDSLRTSVFLPQSVYNIRLRDFYAGMNGAQLYGRIDVGAAGAFTYQACLGNNNYDTENGSVAYYFNNALTNVANSIPALSGSTFETTSLESDYIMAGMVGWESTFGLRLGVSGMSTRNLEATGYFYVPPSRFNPTTSLASSGATASDWRSFVFSAEYVWDELTLASEINQEAIVIPGQSDLISGGGYVSAAYRVHQKVELGSYYSVIIGDLNDRHGEGQGSSRPPTTPDYYAWSRDTAFSVRVDPVPSWVVKLEAHYVDGTSALLSSGLSEMDEFERYWWYFAAKTSYSF